MENNDTYALTMEDLINLAPNSEGAKEIKEMKKQFKALYDAARELGNHENEIRIVMGSHINLNMDLTDFSMAVKDAEKIFKP